MVEEKHLVKEWVCELERVCADSVKGGILEGNDATPKVGLVMEGARDDLLGLGLDGQVEE